jgi:hypothetical protein
VQPLARLVPEWLPAEKLLSLMLVLEDESERVWKPAFAEIEEALAFIIEEFEDGRFTVFAPFVPTPFAGAIYVLDAARVHPLDVSMTPMLRVISKWGTGGRGACRRRGNGAQHALAALLKSGSALEYRIHSRDWRAHCSRRVDVSEFVHSG